MDFCRLLCRHISVLWWSFKRVLIGPLVSEAMWPMTRCTALAFALMFAGSAMATEPNWPTGPYRYIVVDQAVRDVLVEFGRNIGTPVRVTSEVGGRVSGGMPQVSAREFLNDLCRRYGLIWHFDGSVLHVATEAEVRTEVFELGVNTPARAAERLDALGIADARFPVRFSQVDNVVSVSGPPTYIRLVQETLGIETDQPADEPISQKAAAVRVFRGRSAEIERFDADQNR